MMNEIDRNYFNTHSNPNWKQEKRKRKHLLILTISAIGKPKTQLIVFGKRKNSIFFKKKILALSESSVALLVAMANKTFLRKVIK